MANKRRRERDRPKAGPDLGYNPNKRVLLSYSDDEDGGEEESKQVQDSMPPVAVDEELADDVELANYQIPAYEEDVDCNTLVADGKENEQPDVEDAHTIPEQAAAPTNRQRNAHHKKKHNLGRNKSTNQKPALGSMAFQFDDDEEESGDDYDTDTEGAMAYLRSVRAERQTLPSVLSAPRQAEEYDAEVDDGYVSEDAFIGLSKGATIVTVPAEYVDAREAFDSLLKQRFLRQRAVLHAEAEQDLANASLDDGGEALETRSTSQWTSIMQKTPPTTVQLRSMDEDLVLRLLSILQRRILRLQKAISSAASCWIWSLLAKLDDVGTMNNDQVSTVREFGKRAVLILTSFTTPAAAEQLQSMEDEADGDCDGTSDQEEVAEGNDTDMESKDNTLATLDTIITLVGDVFGQRDLLEFRRPWTVEGADKTISEY